MLTAPDAYLPHRYPFRMLDRIVAVTPGQTASAITLVSRFGPEMPQTLLVECVAQLAGVAVGQPGEGGFLAAVDRAEFGGVARCGDTLDISVTVVKSFGRLHLMEGRVACGDAVLLTVALTLGTGTL